jgi:hypothetical protein
MEIKENMWIYDRTVKGNTKCNFGNIMCWMIK